MAAHIQARIVVDSRLATPADARLFEAAAPVLFVAAGMDEPRAASLRARGAEIVSLPSAEGRVDLDALLSELARRAINELHIEAGARLNAALLSAGWVDELLVYQAPMLIGPGRGMAALPALQTLEGVQRFHLHHVDRVGEDLRLLLRR
jgi:diaminohydroxyphosphoribosylaminopyrimidine deaminase/5-amino-6-(5-phosphoribosylamino)uracil reductase